MLETRALVLDDDEGIADALRQHVLRAVRSVDQETDCDRALELFAEHKHPVVILDLMMPKMNGLEVMREMHRIEPRTQVILVTGYPSAKYAIEAVNRHAFAFLLKPFDARQLRGLVEDAFARYQAQTRATDDIDGHTEAEITTLYRAVADAMTAIERRPDDPTLRDHYRQCLEHLRTAQAAESERAARIFRDQLALKPGAGYAAIEAARRVISGGTRSS